MLCNHSIVPCSKDDVLETSEKLTAHILNNKKANEIYSYI